MKFRLCGSSSVRCPVPLLGGRRDALPTAVRLVAAWLAGLKKVDIGRYVCARGRQLLLCDDDELLATVVPYKPEAPARTAA
jgi:hypothetical protein